ncbi:IMPACT family protein [Mycoplasmopsis pullorum]|uniref:Proline dipeptidase n=1 Tax=Mycoplasmopsis pullorum TaxID=48003 RepID=A0A1L4FS99_9BACT|nr:YigZ family protein [Mycoplasmopsis pullorum]APJ38464.1 proline dipeptidase [Mycoplasmopsis pullorum]
MEEIVIKKSSFLSIAINVNSKEEAKKIITKYKQNYKKATHVCSAYYILENGVEMAGFDDDGEPKNTAGRPIYELLKLKKVFNVVIIVIRYYGGIQLGAGGLVRAYRQSASAAITKYLNN